VTAINVNIITIYNINIEVNADDPMLTVLQIGDVIRVQGDVEDRDGLIVIVAINITFINIEVYMQGEDVWRDNGNCSNPPPPWAPANGWRRRCDSNNGSSGSHS
jgi:hypothetical protein